MNLRQLRIGLWSLAGLLGVAALLAVILAAALPLDGPSRASDAAPRRGVLAGDKVAAKVIAGDVWNLDLRRPLVDAPQAAAGAPSTFVPPSMPTLRVLGTVVEANHSMALIDVGSSTQLKSVGDVVNGLRIDAINEDGCVVNFDGRPVAVAIDRPSAPVGTLPAPARRADPYGDRR